MLGLPQNISVKWETSDSFILFKLPPKNILDKFGLKFAWTIKMDIPILEFNEV